MRIGAFLGVIGTALLLASFSGTNTPLRVTYPKTSAGDQFTFFHQDDFQFTFDTVRPTQKDPSVLLCIAAAFTRLDNGSIDGIYSKNGSKPNANHVNHSVGGALFIQNGNISIPDTRKGAIFTDSLLKDIVKKKTSCFQQIKLIDNGVASGFKDESLFQRRAIVIGKDGKSYVAESSKPMTLKKFSASLVELGAKDALYTDMGGWDEGWFRDEKNYPVTIGKLRTSTSYQTNWVTISKRPTKKK